MALNNFEFRAYESSLDDPNNSEKIYQDIISFNKKFKLSESEKEGKVKKLGALIIAFKNGPKNQEEAVLQNAKLLKNLHNIDLKKGFSHAKGFSDNIDSSNFAFSVGEQAHFPSLLYKDAEAPAKKSELTFLLFTSHTILEIMKKNGSFYRGQKKIRENIEKYYGVLVHKDKNDQGYGLVFPQYVLVAPKETMKYFGKVKKIIGHNPFSRIEIKGSECPFHKFFQKS